MSYCDTDLFVERKLEHLITQYRESPNFIALLTAYLNGLRENLDDLCDIRDAFDIDTATDHQLTVIGNIVGWPRNHCAGRRLPIFGFDCDDDGTDRGIITGDFCPEGVHFDCDINPSYGEYNFDDDELYRRFIKAKVIAEKRDYSLPGIIEAAEVLFDSPASAKTSIEEPATVNLIVHRLLTDTELAIANLFQHVLPIAPGVKLVVFESDGEPFSFDAPGNLCPGKLPAPLGV